MDSQGAAQFGRLPDGQVRKIQSLREYPGPAGPAAAVAPPGVARADTAHKPPTSNSSRTRTNLMPPPANTAVPGQNTLTRSAERRNKSFHQKDTVDLTRSLNDLRLSNREGTTDEGANKEKSKVPSFPTKVIISANGISYTAEKIVGQGSFGVVIKAYVNQEGEVKKKKEYVAIKKVLQDRRFKNRELQIMQLLSHCNVVLLKNSFYTNGEKDGDIYLNLVLEYIPETVYRVCRHYQKHCEGFPLMLAKVYTYQLLKALQYIHNLGVCHRDIKPQNLLVDPSTSVLKLCDFGSAKILVENEPNVAYICSRYYRAPELIFGAVNYSTAIDVWSAGCVLGELLVGNPLFPGESGVDMLVEIIKVLGTPSREQIKAMNHNYTDFKFPEIKPRDLKNAFKRPLDDESVAFLEKLLAYNPKLRLSAEELCHDPYFDELRAEGATLPHGMDLPPLEGINC